MSERRNQRQAILNVLIAAHGAEVPSFELAKYALQYCSRVSELRKLGFTITNRVERVNGQAHGFFKLEMGASRVIAKKPVAIVPEPKNEGELSLFGDIAPFPD